MLAIEKRTFTNFRKDADRKRLLCSNVSTQLSLIVAILTMQKAIALVRYDIRPAKSPPSLVLRMQILNFIMNLNSQSSNDEKNAHVKTTRRQRQCEKMSRKRGLVVNFEHVT